MADHLEQIGTPFMVLRDAGTNFLRRNGEELAEQNFNQVARNIAQGRKVEDVAIIFKHVLDSLTNMLDILHRRGRSFAGDRSEEVRQLHVLETIMAKYSVGFAGTVMTRADVKTGVGFKRDVSEHLRA